jgi:hypothetical protein
MELEVKSEVIETKAPEKEQELSELQQILKSFNDTLPSFLDKVGNFQGSMRQLKRVMANLALSPLNKQDLVFDDNLEEKELFELGELVSSTKYMLMLLGLEAEGKIQILKPLDEQPAPKTDEEK